jgi:energy-coupling factor transporter transmembrane protein EcfT
MTYRRFFLLLDRMDALTTTMHTRGTAGWRHPVRQARALAAAIGTLALYSLDLAERDFDLLTIRGYDGRLK